MVNWFILGWFFLVSVPFHELGHYVMFRWFGYKPKLEPLFISKKYLPIPIGIGIGRNCIQKIPMSKMMVIAISGLVFATVVSFWDMHLMATNFIASFIDILNLFAYFYIFSKGHDLSKWNIKEFLKAHPEHTQPSKYDLLVRKLKRKFKRKFRKFQKDWASGMQKLMEI